MANPPVSHITLLDGNTYDVVDAKARADIAGLTPGGKTFKDLAYKDEASGTYTPSGTLVNGTLPSFEATVVGERLVLSFNAGSSPTFSGTQATITVR